MVVWVDYFSRSNVIGIVLVMPNVYYVRKKREQNNSENKTDEDIEIERMIKYFSIITFCLMKWWVGVFFHAPEILMKFSKFFSSAHFYGLEYLQWVGITQLRFKVWRQ